MAITNVEKKNHTYLRLREEFVGKIESRKWPVNSKLPSENVLAKEYAVSRDTIRKALKTLELEGLLVAEQGRGRTVASPGQRKAASAPVIKTRTIGLVISKIESDAYGDIESVQSALHERDFNLLLYTLAGKEEKDSYVCRPFDNIHREQIDGLLVYYAMILPEDIIGFNKLIPTVSLYKGCAQFGIPSFYVSWELVAYQASKHLFEQGYTKQLTLLNQTPTFRGANEEMIRGVKFAHHQRGVRFDKDRVLYTAGLQRSHDEKSIRPILDKMDKCDIDSMLTYLNEPAVRVAEYAVENGIKIPEELGIVALSDSKGLDPSPIPITAISLDRSNISGGAAEMLADLLEGKTTKDSCELDNPFFGTVIPRQSTVKNNL
ncbi:MAG: GntR family transcriptional regulator [Anaerohalosphaeraceae bacterium]|nr:GntR family transcriptional regulator [Anaerohalosphaeraceae bacterium]